MTRSLLVLLGLVAGATASRADIVTRPVEYKHGATVLDTEAGLGQPPPG